MKDTNENSLSAQVFKEVMLNYKSGHLVVAEDLCRKALLDDPENVRFLQMLATIAAQSGRYDESVELFGQAIKVEKNNPQLFFAMGVTLEIGGSLDEALLSYKNAVSLKPDYIDAHINIGNILRKQGKFDEDAPGPLLNEQIMRWSKKETDDYMEAFNAAIKAAAEDASLPPSDSKSQVNLTSDQWKTEQKRWDETSAQTRLPFKQKINVSVQEEMISGVHVYRVKPRAIVPENRNRLLVHVHGGGYVFESGEEGTHEAVLMANFGKIEVVSVDYRMPPDFPFPAALDDALTVWKEIASSRDTKNLGLLGSSSGGGLTLALVLKLKELKMSLPGAIMAGAPWSDMTKTGDTFYTNGMVDNAPGDINQVLELSAKLYAGGHDLKEPLLSPVYGDLGGFPPTILLSGTHDIFLSSTVHVHQKLLQAGIEAELLVVKGQSHMQHIWNPNAPETAAAWNEVSKFFDRHLGK